MAHDVFLSYSNKDKTAADAVCHALEQNRIRVWMAPRDVLAGVGWAQSIIGAINGARVMVLVFSGHANGSPQIEREVERAVNKGVPVVPVRIEDVPPSEALEYFISAQHWLDAFTPPFEQHVDRLADAVKRLLESDFVRGTAGERPLPDAIPFDPTLAEGETPKPQESASEKPAPPVRKSIWRVVTAGLTVIVLLGGGWFVLGPRLIAEAQKSAFDTAFRTGTIEALDAVIGKYPTSPLADSARTERDKLKSVAPATAKLNELRVAIKGDANGRIKAADFDFVANGVKMQFLPLTQSLAATGVAEAQFVLGMLLLETPGHVDPEGAAEAFTKAANQNYPDAQANLGVIYQKGILKTGRDLSKARHWFEAASENGDAKAQYWLGCYYQYGWGGLAKDRSKALDLYEKAVAGNYASAEEALQIMTGVVKGASPCAK